MKTKIILLFSVFSVALKGQLYVPGGSPQPITNSSNNIGIGLSNPSTALEIEQGGSDNLLRLNTELLPVLGGGWATPDYAVEIWLDDQQLGTNTRTFYVKPNGDLHGRAGDFGSMNVGSNADVGTNVNVGNNANIGNNLNVSGLSSMEDELTVSADAFFASDLYLGSDFSTSFSQTPTSVLFQATRRFHINNTDAYSGGNQGVVTGLLVESNGNFTDNSSFQVKNLNGITMDLSERGSLSIHRNLVPNTGLGQTYGLSINNDGLAGHDYALSVTTGHGKVFTVGNAGHVHIASSDGPNGLNFDIPDGFRLYVQDGIRTERVRVDVAADNGWADYVFEDGYELMPIAELEAYIKEHRRLPGVPSAEEVAKDGIDLAEMNKILLEKVEELTLRIIELEKKN